MNWPAPQGNDAGQLHRVPLSISPTEPPPALINFIAAVQGRGLMLGIKPAVPVLPLVEKLRGTKLLTSPAEGGVIRIVPPLIIEIEHVQEALAILREACKEGL